MKGKLLLLVLCTLLAVLLGACGSILPQTGIEYEKRDDRGNGVAMKYSNQWFDKSGKVKMNYRADGSIESIEADFANKSDEANETRRKEAEILGSVMQGAIEAAERRVAAAQSRPSVPIPLP